MRCAIYARVSTDDQRCALQIEELRRYCDARDWDIYRVYSDAMSGAKTQRPGRGALMADAEKHCFDAVVVYKLDRWGRSLVDVLESIRELEGLGIRWIATTQGLDTDKSNPTSRLLLQMLGAVAEFERTLIVERVKSGMARARAHGTKSGVPIGGAESVVYDREKAYADRCAGMSWGELKEKYKVAPSTIRDGITRYARRMRLPAPPTGEERQKIIQKLPQSGKPTKLWECPICGKASLSRRVMLECCPAGRAEKLRETRGPERMAEICRLAVESRRRKAAERAAAAISAESVETRAE
jgi:putative DNA-invertase from lambdoid prophage Rac